MEISRPKKLGCSLHHVQVFITNSLLLHKFMQRTTVKVKHIQGIAVSQQVEKNTLLISYLTNADHKSDLQKVYTVDELHERADIGFTNPFDSIDLSNRKGAIV